MEIPIINRIIDFESDINSLNNPSFISQVYSLFGIEEIYEAYNLWDWGALILVLVASLSTIINTLKILIIRSRRRHSLPSQPLLDDTDFDTDTDSSCVSSDDELEYEEPSTSHEWQQVDENFRVRGSGDGGNSVVKLWDNLGIGFRLDLDDSHNVLNMYDANKETKLTSIFGRDSVIHAVSTSSSSTAIVVSAGADSLSSRVAVSAWDRRLHSSSPVILSEWRPKRSIEKITTVNTKGMEQVYIKGDVVGKLTVGDMRKVSSSLMSSNVETWWDADAVWHLERVD
ncbi:uncharacterized protein LOC105779077 [Gossypium raimondii]|uniref:uncharacterized protein LOC105779077 n=1 Tax=Gossypium raimondii TaxID=29730 RepID=UPI00063A9367|nr:uncharacterized protein LOC105779077 [Gossypium raimondii]